MARVVLEKIRKSYGGETVLDDLSLEIADGEIFFLLGPSGCGKSTLLRILAGLLKEDGGAIFFDGEPIGSLPPEKRHAAMVFQNYALWPHMNVRENVTFGLRCAKMNARDAARRADEVLEKVRMREFADRKIQALSGGQQQRVALARALALKPRLLLLDEPLSNLDARLRETMRGEIRDVCRSEHLTALYVTHDRQEAFSVGDRIALMRRGAICQTGTPEEVYDFPRDRFCAEFLGDVNVLSGSTADGFFTTEFGKFRLGREIPGAATAMIRPEEIKAVAPGCGFPARIRSVLYLGDSRVFKAETLAGNVGLAVRECAGCARRENEIVHLDFAAGKLLNLFEAR
ncbi:MAG: ABC transporter ATP-binding protein [Victivallaceae bacterium]|nr:ABC transporter ATP-binding protein [Victivallaceae bacterium]